MQLADTLKQSASHKAQGFIQDQEIPQFQWTGVHNKATI